MSRFLTAGILQQAANKKEAFSMQINTELPGSANDTFILPTADVTNILVDWGDGTTDNYTTAGDKTHVYASPGIYTINITGIAGQIVTFRDEIDNSKVLRVYELGDLGWTSAIRAFETCNNLLSVQTSIGSLCKNVTSMNGFLYRCSSLETVESRDWDVGNLTIISTAFASNPMLTELDVSLWDTKNLERLFWTFRSTQLSDLKCQNWDITKVEDMRSFAKDMTIPTTTYDQILINWNAQRSDWTNLINGEIHFGNSKYTLGGAAETARSNMIANGVTNLIDGGGI